MEDARHCIIDYLLQVCHVLHANMHTCTYNLLTSGSTPVVHGHAPSCLVVMCLLRRICLMGANCS